MTLINNKDLSYSRNYIPFNSSRILRSTRLSNVEMGKSAHIPAINPVAILFTANPCWNRILSYLPLSDIESLAKSHSRLKEIVKSYLREGNALLIDQETLWRYPIESNDNVYSKYGSLATTMEVTGFRNRSLLLLMPFFPKVQTLTVRRVYSGLYLKGSYEHNPSPLPGVRRLTLIGYSEEEKRDLSPSETKEPLALPYMSSLQSLTLIRCTINEFWCNPLKRLTIDSCWTAIPLTVVRKFSRLEYLRVLGSVDWKQKEQIDSLGLKTVDLVHYSPVPTEENLILKLNDDCLLYLQRFLPSHDWISVHEAHPRFQHLRIARYSSDFDSRERHPLATQKEFYERIGPLVSSLDFLTRKTAEFRAEMPHFSTLTELRLTPVEDINDPVVVIPEGLCEFRELFQRLNGTLRVLHLEYSTEESYDAFVTDGLSRLTNIVEFRCEKVDDQGDFYEFLLGNQDRMRSLGLSGQFRYTRDLMRVVSGMRNLRKLSLDCYFIHSAALDIPRGALPLLEELSISIDYNQDGKVMTEFLDALDLAQLKSFRICGRQCRSQVVWHRMVNLVELEVDSVEFFELVSDVFVFTNLEKLRAPFKDDRVLDLVKGLPKMTVLDNSSPKVGDTVAIKVLEYLRQSKRQLLLNGYRME